MEANEYNVLVLNPAAIGIAEPFVINPATVFSGNTDDFWVGDPVWNYPGVLVPGAKGTFTTELRKSVHILKENGERLEVKYTFPAGTSVTLTQIFEPEDGNFDRTAILVIPPPKPPAPLARSNALISSGANPAIMGNGAPNHPMVGGRRSKQSRKNRSKQNRKQSRKQNRKSRSRQSRSRKN